ncbi:hypothetical protein EON64_21100 [archaeon]|nr:MAG: hypothetical protein EON64_21100 [archaeon]
MHTCEVFQWISLTSNMFGLALLNFHFPIFGIEPTSLPQSAEKVKNHRGKKKKKRRKSRGKRQSDIMVEQSRVSSDDESDEEFSASILISDSLSVAVSCIDRSSSGNLWFCAVRMCVRLYCSCKPLLIY